VLLVDGANEWGEDETTPRRGIATSAARATSQEVVFGARRHASGVCVDVGMTRTKESRYQGLLTLLD